MTEVIVRKERRAPQSKRSGKDVTKQDKQSPAHKIRWCTLGVRRQASGASNMRIYIPPPMAYNYYSAEWRGGATTRMALRRDRTPQRNGYIIIGGNG
jgi:hypothetical protein